jgi:pterin-4a-carbinolamine dehydratase
MILGGRQEQRREDVVIEVWIVVARSNAIGREVHLKNYRSALAVRLVLIAHPFQHEIQSIATNNKYIHTYIHMCSVGGSDLLRVLWLVDNIPVQRTATTIGTRHSLWRR